MLKGKFCFVMVKENVVASCAYMVSTLNSRVRTPDAALAWGIVLCSWARHLTLTVSLSTQVYKWVLANFWGNLTKLQGSDLWWTSILSRGSRNTSCRFMLQKPGHAPAAMSQPWLSSVLLFLGVNKCCCCCCCSKASHYSNNLLLLDMKWS